MSSIGFCVAERPMRVERLRGESVEAFERKREMRAALVVGDGVDFVDDHGLHACAAFRGSFRP